MDRLPVELFFEVLSFAAAAAPSDAVAEIVHLWEMRVAAASVSTSWRDLVYGRVAAWSTVWVYRFTPAAFLEFVLARTGGADITLVLDLQPRHSLDLEASTRRVVCARSVPFLAMLDRVLQPRFRQVARLRVFAADGEEWSSFQDRLTTYAGPRLRALHVSCARPHFAGPPHPGVLPWASRLEDVAAAGLWFRQPAGTFANLTRLEIGWLWDPAFVSWSVMSDVLNAAQQLVHLRIHDVECVDIDPLRLAVLPVLTRMWISADSDLCGSILHQFRAPALRSLDLTVRGEASVAVIARSAERLLGDATEVAVTFLLPLGEGFEEFVATLRHVKILDLRKVGGISGYLESTDYDHGGRALVRLLRLLDTGRGVLPCLTALKVFESATKTEVDALFDAFRGSDFEALTCSRDGIRWRLSNGSVDEETFEEERGSTNGIFAG